MRAVLSIGTRRAALFRRGNIGFAEQEKIGSRDLALIIIGQIGVARMAVMGGGINQCDNCVEP